MNNLGILHIVVFGIIFEYNFIFIYVIYSEDIATENKNQNNLAEKFHFMIKFKFEPKNNKKIIVIN